MSTGPQRRRDITPPSRWRWRLVAGSSRSDSGRLRRPAVPRARRRPGGLRHGRDPERRHRADAEQIAGAVEAQTGAEVVVYTQAGTAGSNPTAAAEALLTEWGVGDAEVDDGLVIFLETDPAGGPTRAAYAAGEGFMDRYMVRPALGVMVATDMEPRLQAGDADTAVLTALGRVVSATFGPGTGSDPGGNPDAPPPGPPFPEPELDRAVYDFAGVLSPDTIVEVEATIDAIEERTGAEVVVYTQDAGTYGLTTEETERKARALIDQWGIGRAGFNDGMVIFFDLDPSLEHGQVQLYAGPGFEAAFLSNSERQAIFENDMLPHLRNADFDSALEAAMDEDRRRGHARARRELQPARAGQRGGRPRRRPDRVLRAVPAGPSWWRRFGKDPVYLDDPSILMPAPPPDLTAASGAMVMDGVDVAPRADDGDARPCQPRPGRVPRGAGGSCAGAQGRRRHGTGPGRRRHGGPAGRNRDGRPAPPRTLALDRLCGRSRMTGIIEPDDLPKFGSHVAEFDSALERHVVDRGWFAEKPSKVVTRWAAAASWPWSAGRRHRRRVQHPGLRPDPDRRARSWPAIVILVLARSMPAVTMPGAMIRAMLAAYRRTLQKTMEQARSMQQVVDEAGLDWLDTPDQAVVWGTALGLQGEIEGVLQRSLEDLKQGRRRRRCPTSRPGTRRRAGRRSWAPGAGGSGASVFSDSAIPDLGGMMSALGTIGNSPSSSGGGGGGGGFGGGRPAAAAGAPAAGSRRDPGPDFGARPRTGRGTRRGPRIGE